MAAVSPNGVLGDPAGASADEGRRLLAQLVADLVRAVDAAFPHAFWVDLRSPGRPKIDPKRG